MTEFQPRGVEGERSVRGGGVAAVEPVSGYGAAQAKRVSGVDAELVGTAGERREFDADKLSRTVTSTPLSDRGVYLLYTNLSPLSNSEFAVYFVVNLMWTVIWIQAEWEFGSYFRFSV